jgi:hypothetical protein
MARMRQKILDLVVCLIREPLIDSLLKLVGPNGVWWSLAVTSRKGSFADTTDRNQRCRQRLANKRLFTHVIKQGPEKRRKRAT